MKQNRIIFILLIVLLFTGCAKKQDVDNGSNSIPQHIISLSPAATEILYAVGAQNQIAAVSDLSDFPPEALELPKVGGFDGQTLSIEKIISFNPDLVYLTDGMHNFLIEKLEHLGIKYYISKATSYESVKQEILDIGMITGHSDEAKLLLENMDKRLTELPRRAMIFTSYYEIWNSPYMTCGSTSFMNDILYYSGVENIFADVSQAYPVVSEESIIARNPDIILLPASIGISKESVAQRPGWENISAVVNGNIYVIDDNLFSRPGPRIVEAIASLVDIDNSSKKDLTLDWD